MDPSNRPLSPHLQVYRPQLTSMLSILHRLTGVFLTAGLLLLSYWLVSAAAGQSWYDCAQWFLTSWLGYALLLGFSYALFFHLCNGIRHLFWDLGLGFELRCAYVSGWLVVLASLGLTGLSWALGLLFGLGVW
jgi:succinate dehydrogenase / fumarate reductase cytochrome b subunit